MKRTWFCTVVEMFRPSFKGGQGGIYFTLPELHFRPSLPSLEPVTTVWGMGTGLVMPPPPPAFNHQLPPLLDIFYLCMLCISLRMYTLLISQMQAKTSNWNLFIHCENFKKKTLNLLQLVVTRRAPLWLLYSDITATQCKLLSSTDYR